MALHAWSISYCDYVRSDGFIPAGVWPTLPGWRAAVEALERTGLWQATEGGYQLHDFTDWNRSRAQIAADQASDRARKHGRIPAGKPPEKPPDNGAESGRNPPPMSGRNPPGHSRAPARPVPVPEGFALPGPLISPTAATQGAPPTVAASSRRDNGTNPRALSTNPRAQGINPRTLGTNPRAIEDPGPVPLNPSDDRWPTCPACRQAIVGSYAEHRCAIGRPKEIRRKPRGQRKSELSPDELQRAEAELEAYRKSPDYQAAREQLASTVPEATA